MKILLITHSFYPETVPRAYKWMPIVSYLSQHEKAVFHVVTPRKPDLDRSGYHDDSTEIFETKYGFFLTERMYKYRLKNKQLKQQKLTGNNKRTKIRIRSSIRKLIEYLYFPDQYIEWFPYAVQKSLSLAKIFDYDVIVSNAMPFTSHLIGYRVAQKTGLPLVLEYGDPFGFNPFKNFNRFHKFLADRIEPKIVARANAIVVPTHTSAEGFVNFFSVDPQKVKVIPMSFPEITPPQSVGGVDEDKFTIVYAGAFYAAGRNPFIFLESLSQFRSLYPDLCKRLTIHFYARTSSMDSVLKEYQVKFDSEILVIHFPVERERMIKILCQADLLLNFANEGIYQMPSKLVDYQFAGRRILTIKPEKTLYSPFVENEITCENSIPAITQFLKELMEGDVVECSGKLDSRQLFTASDFQIENVANKYYELFKSVQ